MRKVFHIQKRLDGDRCAHKSRYTLPKQLIHIIAQLMVFILLDTDPVQALTIPLNIIAGFQKIFTKFWPSHYAAAQFTSLSNLAIASKESGAKDCEVALGITIDAKVELFPRERPRPRTHIRVGGLISRILACGLRWAGVRLLLLVDEMITRDA